MQTIHRVSIIFEISNEDVAQEIVKKAIGWSKSTIQSTQNQNGNVCYILTVEFSNLHTAQSIECDITEMLEDNKVWWDYYYT